MSNNPEHPQRASALFQNLGMATFGAFTAGSIIANSQAKIAEGSVKELHTILGNPKTVAGASIAACIVLGGLRLASLHMEAQSAEQQPTTTLDAAPQTQSFGTIQQTVRGQVRSSS